MPRIGNYRAALEAQASRAIGVPVRIGSITAESAGLFPSFELREVVLFDAQQREALRLARVVASVSPRSLFRFSFEQLYLQGPELEVRRDKLGKLHVAGLDMSTDTTGEKRGADWFFAQREFVIEGGKVRWTDEGSGADPLMLTDVTLIARNGGRRHAMRLDATPPEGWGERFTLRGQFRQPLLSVRSGNWQSWDGQVYADLPGFDVSRLGRYAALDARIREGNGAVRVWADVSHGQWVGGAVDLALARVDTTLGDAAAPLMLRGLSGRVAGRLTGKTLEVSTRGLQFESADGTRWPGGDFWLQHTPQQGRTPERGAFKADRLDLGVLALIAHRLPLGQATHKALADFAPRGLVDRIDATWQGSLGAPDRYQAKGRASGLQLASQPAAGTGGAGTGKTPAVGRPGVRGLTIDFDATQAGGKATLSMAQGALDFPGVFEEPVIPVDQVAGSLQWQLDGAKAQVQVANLRFANADAQGEAQIGWRTSDPALRGGARYPGVLDLQGKLTRADGARVFRYLPQDIGKDVRDYVRDSVVKGSASSVDFRVRGDLVDMPFTDPRRGDFRIAARVADVTYAFVPPERGSAVPSHWPTLTALAGELVFERAGMQVRNARGRIVGAPGVEVGKAEAQIADMAHAALLQLDVQAKGALGELLQLAVPLAGAASDAAGQARAAGSADYRLKLALPLAAMDKAKVQASIAFGGNDLQVAPEAPPFTQLRGTLNFTESGFTLVGGQARLVGGDVRVEGRGRYAGTGHDMSFSGQGTATAEGLRGARQVDWLARLARKATGSAPYAASFALRDGASEFSLSSSLQGLALQLPAPLTKPADEALPLRIEKKLVQREARAGAAPLLNDQLSLELGRIVTARYDRDISGNEPRVLRGGVGVGLAPGESAAPPARGVLANVNLARIDVDAWQALFNETTGAAPEVPASGAAAPAADEAQGYLPSVVALRAQELRVSGRKLSNVVVGGSREGNLWRGNIDATELSGYVEYRQAQAGRIYARLARLKIAPSETTEVESLLDAQPATLPALDIVVDDFELLGKRLGKLEIGAVNRGGAEREWQLDKLNLSTPEASFSARGSWATAPSGRPRAGQRRTAMAFKLDMTDAGALLARLGMKDVVARGRGRMEGDVEWRGSPFSLDYPSMSGQLNVNVEQGQFLKAEPGIAKLLGVLSLQALPRRLTLDFRDVFSTGFAFDFVRGDAKIVDGTATTNNLQMKGVNAAVLMDGSANLAKETQDLHVVVVPEINAGTASLVATAINPAIGLGTFLAQMVLRRPLIAAATQEFRVDGTWADPKVTRMPRRPAVAAPLPPTARDDPKTETTQ